MVIGLLLLEKKLFNIYLCTTLTYLASTKKHKRKKDKETTTKLNVMRDLVHLIVFSYNTQSSKKDWKDT